MRHCLILLFCTLSFFSFGQLKQTLADKHFENLEYFKAAPMYGELADKFIRKNKGAVQSIRRAAISYAKIFDFKRSIHYDAILHASHKMAKTEEDWLRYIHSLRITAQYERAELLINEANILFPNNPTFERWKNDANKLTVFFADTSMSAVEVLPFNSDMGDFAPIWHDNGLVYATKSTNRGFLVPRYGWDNSYFINLMHVTQKDGVWGKPSVLKNEFFSRAHDGPVAFSPDGSEMMLTRNILDKNKGEDKRYLALFVSQKNAEGEWTDLQPFPHNVKQSNTGHAAYSPDGNRIYFVSDRIGGIGGTDIYYSDRLGDSWSPPIILSSSINTERNEMFPYMNKKGKLYFASDGHFGLGGLDIFMVNPSGANAKPVNMGAPINSAADDFGLISDDDGKTGYFSSDRGDFVDRILYWEKRLPVIQLTGTVYLIYDEMEPVVAQEVVIEDFANGSEVKINTNSEGVYTAEIVSNNEYLIKTRKEYFQLIHPEQLRTAGIVRDTILVRDLYLKPTKIDIAIKVIEKGTKTSIPNAKLSVIHKESAKDTLFMSDENGLAMLTVDRHQDYWARASKKGYIDAETAFETGSQSGKVIELELELPKIKKNEKFKLENIFYDLNKATLRPESMSSLDKLAEFLLENGLKIELSAHTDSRGSDSYNMRLSQQRAQSCADYLITKGVPKSKIIARGYGETKLVNRCKNGIQCSEEEHQENRRTEVKILDL